MSAPISPYLKRRIDEVMAGNAEAHARLTGVVRRMSHLTDEERLESERLISLPYGAEEFALRCFVLRNFRVEAA